MYEVYHTERAEQSKDVERHRREDWKKWEPRDFKLVCKNWRTKGSARLGWRDWIGGKEWDTGNKETGPENSVTTQV